MKKDWTHSRLLAVFIAVQFPFALFYTLFPNFGKAISQAGGLGWCVLCVGLLAAFFLKNKTLFLVCDVLVALLQVAIFICFAAFMPFHVAPIGMAIHGVLLLAAFFAYVSVKGVNAAPASADTPA